MFDQKTFSSANPRVYGRLREAGWAEGISSRKILRLAIVLTMSFLCWMGVGCFAVEMLQLAGR
jgi:hypothetical protein